jgi:hypothetical protein
MVQGSPPGQQPKKGKGCWIAAAVVGGILLLFAVVVGVFCVKLAGKGMKMAQEVANAPGTKELGALGCRPGMVMDMEKAVGLFTGMDASAAIAGSPASARFLVMCTVPSAASAPTCEDVKAQYLLAVPAPGGRFMTVVQAGNDGNKPICKKLYDESGGLIRDLGVP